MESKESEKVIKNTVGVVSGYENTFLSVMA